MFDISNQIKAYLKENAESVIEIIDDSESDVKIKIHEIRKCLKKLRAALRLIRGNFDEYKKYNVIYRDAGRKLSLARDATSVIEALENLKSTYNNQLYKNTFKSFTNFIVEKRDRLHDLKNMERIFQEIKNDILETLQKMEVWEIENSFAFIKPGMIKVYKRGKKAYNRCCEDASPPKLHEWRKRAKYLRYQLRIIIPLWPEIIDPLEDEYHKLTDFLGDDRDLFMLENVVDNNEHHFASEEDSKLLKAIISSQRREYQMEAIKYGKKLYSLPKKEFTEWLGSSYTQVK
ncbi:CHAD domain-containing protein [Mangrovivirga sp. M17]|uniref:CHAD domain-containing protein n=1 Tax=Mangrovivirga halotolerans TaxID=2993936 RepID=A0ABT3RTM3_9BACT|nr:CHAD domain-containing protein [Mangrovivirga halotolerans]MCX2745133.1 CHAD domain-containing protein [Mangrovivirga halotolerans]